MCVCARVCVCVCKVQGMPALVSKPWRFGGPQMCKNKLNSEHPHKFTTMNFFFAPPGGGRVALQADRQTGQDRTGQNRCVCVFVCMQCILAIRETQECNSNVNIITLPYQRTSTS